MPDSESTGTRLALQCLTRAVTEYCPQVPVVVLNRLVQYRHRDGSLARLADLVLSSVSAKRIPEVSLASVASLCRGYLRFGSYAANS